MDNITSIVALILSVWIGAFVGFWFRGKTSNIPNYFLVFSGGFLLSITLNEIFPHIYQSQASDVGAFIILGVIIQIFLEFLTRGVEHGHVHHEKSETVFPFALLIGLLLHSFIEGIPISSGEHHSHDHLHESLSIGVFVHKLPVSFLLSYYLFKSNLKIIYSLLLIFLFSISSPLGILVGENFLMKYQNESLAVAGGVFLHISSLIIFESNKKHSFNLIKLLIIVFGMLSAYLIL
ncbi:MAG: ZIP family metal transporter [Flavobacteriales bacterium]|nr:ZIP family metal transporter [Flavobacteriales bacterium]